MGILRRLKAFFTKGLNQQELVDLQSHLSYRFQNTKILEQALTHSSLVEKQPSHKYSYERLEYLGDAVLELIITDYLYHRFPSDTEGELTRKRAAIVNKSTLASISNNLSLSDFIRSQTVPTNPIEKSESVLSDVFEAIVGGIYIDNGMETARSVILNLMNLDQLEHEDEFPLRNYKGELIEYCHTHSIPLPQFQTVEKSGPDHSRQYKIAVLIDGNVYGVGEGPSKKKAGKQAAQEALFKISEDISTDITNENRT